MNIFEKRKVLLQEKFLKVLSEAYNDYDDEESDAEPHYGEGTQEDHFRALINGHDEAKKPHKELHKALKGFEKNNEVPEEISDSFNELKDHHEENAKDHPHYKWWSGVMKNIQLGKEQGLFEEVLVEKTHEDVFTLLHKHRHIHSKKHKDHIDKILDHFGKKIYGGSDEQPETETKPTPRKPVLKSGNKKYLSNNRPYSTGSMMYREDVDDGKNKSQQGRSDGTDIYEKRTALKLWHLMGKPKHLQKEYDDLDKSHREDVEAYKKKQKPQKAQEDLHYMTASADHSAHKFANSLKETHGITGDDLLDLQHVGTSGITQMAKDHDVIDKNADKVDTKSHTHDIAIAAAPKRGSNRTRIIGASLKNAGHDTTRTSYEELNNIFAEHQGENTHQTLEKINEDHKNKTIDHMKSYGMDTDYRDKKGKVGEHSSKSFGELVERFKKEHGDKPGAQEGLDNIRDSARKSAAAHMMNQFNGHDVETQRAILHHISRSETDVPGGIGQQKDLPYHLIDSNDVKKDDFLGNLSDKFNDDHLFDHENDHPHVQENMKNFNVEATPTWADHPITKTIKEDSGFHARPRESSRGASSLGEISFHSNDTGLPFFSTGIGMKPGMNSWAFGNSTMIHKIVKHDEQTKKATANLSKFKENSQESYKDHLFTDHNGKQLKIGGSGVIKDLSGSMENVKGATHVEYVGKDKINLHSPIAVAQGIAHRSLHGENGVDIGPHPSEDGLDPNVNFKTNALANAYSKQHEMAKEAHDPSKVLDYGLPNEFLQDPKNKSLVDKEKELSLAAYNAHTAASNKHKELSKNNLSGLYKKYDDYSDEQTKSTPEHLKPAFELTAAANKATVAHDKHLNVMMDAYKNPGKTKAEPKQKVAKTKAEEKPAVATATDEQLAHHTNKIKEYKNSSIEDAIRSDPEYNEKEHGPTLKRYIAKNPPAMNFFTMAKNKAIKHHEGHLENQTYNEADNLKHEKEHRIRKSEAVDDYFEKHDDKKLRESFNVIKRFMLKNKLDLL